MTTDKEGYYLMIKGSIQEEDITIVNTVHPTQEHLNTKTRPIYMLFTAETHVRPQDTYRLKVRGWENIFYANGKQKKAGVAIFISDKIDLKIKKITEIRKDTT